MAVPEEKVVAEEAASPIQLPRTSASSTEVANTPTTAYLSDEKPGPIPTQEQTIAQPANSDNEGANLQAPAPDSAEDNYKPKSLKFWLIIVSAFVSMFLVALDRTIISTAIPTITDDFHSLSDIGWYGSSYMLTTAAFQLVWGRIYRFYDLRWTFLTCIVIFEIGSAICGSAPSSSVFIAGMQTSQRGTTWQNMRNLTEYRTGNRRSRICRHHDRVFADNHRLDSSGKTPHVSRYYRLPEYLNTPTSH